MVEKAINEFKGITNLEARLDRIEETIAEVASGNLLARIPIDKKETDRLTAIEIGINLILSDLEAETSHRLTLSELLSKAEGDN